MVNLLPNLLIEWRGNHGDTQWRKDRPADSAEQGCNFRYAANDPWVSIKVKSKKICQNIVVDKSLGGVAKWSRGVTV